MSTFVCVTGTMLPLGGLDTPLEMRSSAPEGTEGRSKSLLKPELLMSPALQAGA